MKVAFVHDWLNGMRGGEKVLEVLCELYPQADIFTLLYEPAAISPIIRQHRVFVSFIQRLPLARKHYRYYLPMFPMAIEQFDLRGYDLVISSSHCVAKGALVAPGVPHLCYCHTPMRYAWEQYYEYFPSWSLGPVARWLIPSLISRLRVWDVVSAQRVDAFIANSQNVAHRIEKYYGREALVVYPPVEAERFQPAKTIKDYFLVVSALVPYKRIDRAIAACNALRLPLVVVGHGPESRRLRRLAKATVRFVEHCSDQALVEWYAGCRAFLFPGEEDFGITPLEAMAAGRPVIALARGGVCESVVPGKTGLFFYEPTVAALCSALERFQNMTWDSTTIRQRALEFDRPRFKVRLAETIKQILKTMGEKAAWRVLESATPSIT